MKLDWFGLTIGMVVLVFYLGRNLRFLLQGRRFRRQSVERQAALTREDDLWHIYHGYRIPRSQLIGGILVAVTVFGYLICRDLGMFGR